MNSSMALSPYDVVDDGATRTFQCATSIIPLIAFFQTSPAAARVGSRKNWCARRLRQDGPAGRGGTARDDTWGHVHQPDA